MGEGFGRTLNTPISIHFSLAMVYGKIIPHHLAARSPTNSHVVIPRQEIPAPCTFELPTSNIRPYHMSF